MALNEMKDYVRSRVLKRYLEVSEARRKAVDHGIELQCNLDESRRQVKELSTKLSDAGKLSKEQTRTISELESVLKNMREEHATVSGQLEKLHTRIEDLTSQRDELKTEHARLMGLLKDSQSQLEVSEKELQKMEQELSLSRQREQKATRSIEELQGYVHILETERDSLKLSMQEVQTASAQQAEAHETLVLEHEKWVEENEQLRSRVHEIATELRDVSAHAKSMESVRNKLEQEHGRLIREIEQERKIRTGREQELLDVSEALKARNRDFEHLSGEHQAIVKEVQQLQALHAKDRAEHARLVDVIGNLETERLEWFESYQALREEKDRVQGILDSIQSKWIYRQYRRLKSLLPARH